MKFLVLVFSMASAASILEYKDPEAGLSHKQSGQPGEQVEGEFEFTAPEGLMYRVVYTAGSAGFEAAGDHLPAPVEETDEVAAARSSFMQAFRAAEAEVQEVNNFMQAEHVMEASRRKRSPVTADTSGVEAIGSSPLAGYQLNYAVQYPTVQYPTVQRAAVHYNPGVQYYVPTVHQLPVVDNTPVVGNPAVRVVDNPAVRQVVGKPVYQIGFQGLQPVVAAPALPAERTIMQGDEEPAALAL